MLAVCQPSQFFLPDIREHHVLVGSDSRSVVSYINHQDGLVSKGHAGEQPSCVDACAGQNEPRSRHAVEEQCLFRGVDDPLTRGSENLGSLWQSSSGPLHLRRQLSLPNLFYKEHRCPGPRLDQPSSLCFPPSRSATAGTPASQGKTAQDDSNRPHLEEPTMGIRVILSAESSPVADPLETGRPLSSEWHDMASTARVMGPTCVAARHDPFVLPERVLNTMAVARAPSTRCYYALKWSISSAWCQDRDLDPVTSDVSVVLSFLQGILNKQRSSSTIKVYTISKKSEMRWQAADYIARRLSHFVRLWRAA